MEAELSGGAEKRIRVAIEAGRADLEGRLRAEMEERLAEAAREELESSFRFAVDEAEPQC